MRNRNIGFATKIAAASLMAISLAGCSVLYPNWNTSQKPSDSGAPTPSSSATASASPSASPTTAKVKALINILDSGVDTAAANVYVVAEITNVVEDGGQCTMTFIGAGQTKTVTGKAEINATDTQCHPLQIPLAGLPKGAGLVTVTYNSATHTGTSAAIAVTIP